MNEEEFKNRERDRVSLWEDFPRSQLMANKVAVKYANENMQLAYVWCGGSPFSSIIITLSA